MDCFLCVGLCPVPDRYWSPELFHLPTQTRGQYLVPISDKQTDFLWHPFSFP